MSILISDRMCLELSTANTQRQSFRRFNSFGPSRTNQVLTLLLITTIVMLPAAAWGGPVNGETAVQFLRSYCADCHGEKTQKADFVLHDISPDIAGGKDLERWEKILEMVSIGDMPPQDKKQPTNQQRQLIVDWLTAELGKIGRGRVPGGEAFPKNGNRVNHEALFSGEHKGPAYTTSRLWRISPQIYQRFAANIDMARKLNAPLRVASDEGFRDYALLYADEATIMTMLQNCKRAAVTLIHGRVNTGQSHVDSVLV